MELDKTVVKGKVYGQNIQLSKASTSEIFDYMDRVQELKEEPKKLSKFVLDYLVEHGLDNKLALELEPEHAGKLVDLINGVKKN